MTLNDLTEYIALHFQFTDEKYPSLAGKTAEERLEFAINHLALHFGKTAGKIITVSEQRQHGGELDIADLRVNAAKSVINALMLAKVIGMSEAELIQAIKDKFEHN